MVISIVLDVIAPGLPFNSNATWIYRNRAPPSVMIRAIEDVESHWPMSIHANDTKGSLITCLTEAALCTYQDSNREQCTLRVRCSVDLQETMLKLGVGPCRLLAMVRCLQKYGNDTNLAQLFGGLRLSILASSGRTTPYMHRGVTPHESSSDNVGIRLCKSSAPLYARISRQGILFQEWPTPAEIEFSTSSRFIAPSGYAPWQIRNDYPRSHDTPLSDDKPWLKVDFQNPTGAETYCNLVKEYFFKGNTVNDFIVQRNKDRKWYHPPWLHYGDKGREPINGLAFGGFLPPGYLAKNQNHWVQGWLCSYFNWEAATILGDIWADPNNPKWDTHLRFPVGSVICENIFCDIGDEEVPIAKGSPEAYACIGKLPKDPEHAEAPDGRMDTATRLRLVQVDFAARDDRSPIGWVFGTYACDGRKASPNAWDNVFPIGLQYGNDPDVLQKQYDEGERPTHLWRNPVALALLEELGGNRPWLGWHDRLDGLGDDFMGTCTSCHATAQLSKPDRTPTSRIQDPRPQEKTPGEWVQQYEEVERTWLRNLPHGTPFDDDSLSAEYNIHVEFAYRNYRDWRAKGENK